MSTTPERGFEYFPSPETDDDQERIAHAFLSCSVAVGEWPRARRRLIKARLKSAEQCDHIEAHAISIFRETRDIMLSAIESDNLPLMADPRLLERFGHAHALLALFANPESMPGYRDMVFPPGGGDSAGQPKLADFNTAVWEAEWDTREGPMPTQVTRKRAMSHGLSREMDGIFNSDRRLDDAATAIPLEDYVAEAPVQLSKEQLELLERGIEKLVSQLRAIGKRARLKRAHIEFLVEMAVHGSRQKDNPAAWRAIRDRKRSLLLPEIERLVAAIWERREEFSFGTPQRVYSPLDQ